MIKVRPALRLESYKRGVAISTILNVVNKGLLFLISIVAIHFFGAEGQTGIYFYAYNTVFFIATFITGLNSTVIIPESMRIRAKDGAENAISFLNFFIFIYIFFVSLLFLLFYIDPVGAFLSISRFNKATLTENAGILFWAIPLIGLITIANLLTDILVSYKYFTMPMLVGIFNGISAILFVVLFHSYLGIKSLLIGLIAAYVLNIMILFYLMFRKLGWFINFRIFKVERRIWRNVLFSQTGNLTSLLVQYMPYYLLSIFGNGIITAINLAQQIAALPTALITTQFSNVVGVKFNELNANNDTAKMNEVFLRTGILLFFLVLPCSGFIYLYADRIIQLLFQHGHYAPEWSSYTTEILKVLIFSVPLLIVSTLVARLFMATYKIREGFWNQVILNVTYVLLLIVFVRYTGYIAYPYTFVGIYLISALSGWIIAKLFFPYISYSKLMKMFAVLLLINGAIVAIVAYLKSLWKLKLDIYGDLILGGLLYLVLVIISGYLVQIHKKIGLVVNGYWGFLLNNSKR